MWTRNSRGRKAKVIVNYGSVKQLTFSSSVTDDLLTNCSSLLFFYTLEVTIFFTCINKINLMKKCYSNLHIVNICLATV